jgi:DNA-binding NarL/FixJ family response regulator
MSESSASAPQAPIRVLIVDDHPMVRTGLRMTLLATEAVAVVGEAEDGAAALRVCAAVQPDVVLMDLRLPGLDGVATTQALQRLEPVPRVLVLTAAYDERLIPQALAAGASGYVIKGGSVDDLVAAIQAAHACQ